MSTPHSVRHALTRTSRRAAAAAAVVAGLTSALTLTTSVAASAAGLAPSQVATSGETAATASTIPAINRRALSIAESKRGDRYAFGATGPSSFDCSGLTYYSYRHAGRRIPRTADDQYRAARRIPYSHMKPGDLVFYHYNGHYGHAFHVGMYVRRGLTIAAVDSAEGVAWQRIDFADASFGSFTHR